MTKKFVIAVIFLFALGSILPAMADNIQTLGEYNGTGTFNDPGPYQPPTVVGTFNILPGDTSLTISGTFGNSVASSSSGVNLFLGSTLVGQCVEFATCYQSTTSWSDTISGAALASLGTGIVDFSATETSQFTIRLGVTTLDQVSTVPEPSSRLLLVADVLACLVGLSLMKRKRLFA